MTEMYEDPAMFRHPTVVHQGVVQLGQGLRTKPSSERCPVPECSHPLSWHPTKAAVASGSKLKCDNRRCPCTKTLEELAGEESAGAPQVHFTSAQGAPSPCGATGGLIVLMDETPVVMLPGSAYTIPFTFFSCFDLKVGFQDAKACEACKAWVLSGCP